MTAPADCTNPQPIPVRLGTEAVQVIDTVFPPEQCDLAHADRAMTRGSNMVPDERWNGTA